MARGLDHVAHAVRDLDAAGALYERLGFKVGARNAHPWGTHNRIVQVPGFFVELLTFAEPDKLGHDGFSTLFAGATRDFLQRREGLNLLLLESRDAQADAAAFRAAEVAASDAMRFERQGRRPDGTPVEVAFSVAFARDARSPDAGFAICQQHRPENFWNPVLQQHANAATGIAGVVLVAEQPALHRAFLSDFAGSEGAAVTASGITVPTPRGEIQVMERAAFSGAFGTEPPEDLQGARLAALRFTVTDLAVSAAWLKTTGVPFRWHNGRLVVGPAAAFGATLAFEAGVR